MAACRSVGFLLAMIAPFFLLLVALCGVGAAVVWPGLDALLLVAGPSVVASLYLLVRAGWRGRKTVRYVVIDGSNVMYWATGAPQIAPLRDVVDHVRSQGAEPYVVFDANAGHLLVGRYQHDAELGLRIGLPARQVSVVNKGQPADPVILDAARQLGAGIITNDRYRDWAEQFPEISRRGFLIRGSYRSGELGLDLPPPVPDRLRA